jgi:hypothetical protein
MIADKYFNEMIYDLISEFDDDVDFVVHRGNLELHARTPKDALAAIDRLSSEGWKYKNVQKPQRLLMGVEFDCVTEMFNSVRVMMSIGHVKKWSSRYVGSELKVIPNIVMRANELKNRFVEGLHGMMAAERVWLNEKQ